MQPKDVLGRLFAENSNMRLAGILVDEDDEPIQLADLGGLTLTLYEAATGTVINNKNELDILNANGGTVGATDGAWTMDLSADDMVLVDPNCNKEHHIALFQWVYGDSGEGRHEVHFQVVNMRKVGTIISAVGSAEGESS